MLIARYNLRRAESVLSGLGLIPDFLLALLLQIAVIGITVATGVRIARVASLGSHTALLLPLIVMTLYPAIAFMQIAADQVHHFRGEQFVGNLVARGISRRRIYRRHLLPGVLDAVRRELPRILGTHVATLFITERVFQSRGLVRWMFAYTFLETGELQLGGYQYAFMVHCLIAIITVVAVSYLLARLGMALTLAVTQHA
jgi:peptide/nickel transport system permease protein